MVSHWTCMLLRAFVYYLHETGGPEDSNTRFERVINMMSDGNVAHVHTREDVEYVQISNWAHINCPTLRRYLEAMLFDHLSDDDRTKRKALSALAKPSVALRRAAALHADPTANVGADDANEVGLALAVDGVDTDDEVDDLEANAQREEELGDD